MKIYRVIYLLSKLIALLVIRVGVFAVAITYVLGTYVNAPGLSYGYRVLIALLWMFIMELIFKYAVMPEVKRMQKEMDEIRKNNDNDYDF
jgi:uncharacterized membrane protein